MQCTLLALFALIVGTEALVTRQSLRMGLSVGQTFPADALKKWGCSGVPAVVYFYGADESPSCTKQASAFSESMDDFNALNVKVVGVRNQKGVKPRFAEKYGQTFVVDEGDEVRDSIGIKKDFFGALGGRETYVVDREGVVTFVFNDQFKAGDHAVKALVAAEALPPPPATAMARGVPPSLQIQAFTVLQPLVLAVLAVAVLNQAIAVNFKL
eukprot:CAMPEP_0172640416 /NCGR_PEP_ID=MMETSP1068-20121228/222970_1 /TAXON_ID=35684 /ORGANISM="Pseudopedinella elastica, Strain CCMP716" /LENGTH=211 /DNA_ID=CAMNT_0013453795 /DNA_START=39 /DNA_END=674 /DNA_ORIENTATION=+